MKRTSNFLSRILLPLLLLAGFLLLWGLGFLGDADREGAVLDENEPMAAASHGGADLAKSSSDDSTPMNESILGRTDSVAEPAGTVFLKVVDMRGKPVEGLEMIASTLHGDERDLYALFDLAKPRPFTALGKTDVQGRVAIPKMEGQGVGIAVRDSNWLAIGETSFERPWTSEQDLRLFVTQGGVITGQVVDAHGPVVGASISGQVFSDFMSGGDSNPLVRTLFWQPANYRFATTDAEGNFRIDALLASSNRIDVLAPGCPPERHEFEGPAVGQIRDVGIITVVRGLTVTFTVHSPELLEPGTLLFLEEDGKNLTRGLTGLPLDAQGQLRIEGMRAGDFQWMVARPGAVAMVGELTIPPTGGDIGIEVPGLREVQVLVVDFEGEPIPQFTLEAEIRQGMPRVVHGDGPVVLRCGADAELRVSAETPGYVKTRDYVVPPSEDAVVLTMQRFGALDCLLPGLKDGQVLSVGLVEENEQRALVAGIVPNLKERVVSDQRVHLDRLKPGEYRLVLDHGGGPVALEQVVIRPDQTTSVEVLLKSLVTRDALVVDEMDDRPLANVNIDLWGSEDPSFAIAFTNILGQNKSSALQSDASGRFSLSILPEQSRFVQLEAPGYAPLIVPIAADGPSPHVFRMRRLPSIALEVRITHDRPAARANVSFGHFPDRLHFPIFLGSTILDAQGQTTLTEIAAGPCDLHVTFDWQAGVRYSVPFGGVKLRDGVPLAVTLFPEPGWLSMTTPPMDDLRRIEIREVDNSSVQDLVVTCSDGSWNSTLPLPPGRYRLTAKGAASSLHASCHVKSGVTTPVAWSVEQQNLQIDLLGNSWHRAQLRVKIVDGPHEGAYRDLKMKADGRAHTIDDLPSGPIEVQLVEWWDSQGDGHRMRWTKTVPAGEASIAYSLEDLATATITVLDAHGKALRNTMVQARMGSTGAEGEISGLTDPEGKLKLMMRKGPVILQVYQKGHQPKAQRRTLSGDETWTVRLDK